MILLYKNLIIVFILVDAVRNGLLWAAARGNLISLVNAATQQQDYHYNKEGNEYDCPDTNTFIGR